MKGPGLALSDHCSSPTHTKAGTGFSPQLHARPSLEPTEGLITYGQDDAPDPVAGDHSNLETLLGVFAQCLHSHFDCRLLGGTGERRYWAVVSDVVSTKIGTAAGGTGFDRVGGRRNSAQRTAGGGGGGRRNGACRRRASTCTQSAAWAFRDALICSEPALFECVGLG